MAAARPSRRPSFSPRVTWWQRSTSFPLSLLGDSEWLGDEDVLACGDDKDAKATVITLAASITGKAGIDAGRLRLARQLEPLTAVLISINKRYKVQPGIAIAGMPQGSDRQRQH